MIHKGHAIFIFVHKNCIQYVFTFKKSKDMKGKSKKPPKECVNAKDRYVILEAEVRLFKIDNVDQYGLKKVKTGGKWKLFTVAKYDMEGSYYIEVIGI